MPSLKFSTQAWNEFLSQMDNKSRSKKLIRLLTDISRGGNLGKPEMLKGNYSGMKSRRIDEKNRIIYSENNGTIEIYSCIGHYDDK